METQKYKSILAEYNKVKREIAIDGDDERKIVLTVAKARKRLGLDDSEEGISIYNYVFVKQQGLANGYKGTPYIDFLTFNGWKKLGMRVKKGETSKVYAVAYKSGKKEIEENGKKVTNYYTYPIVYHLFHSSQVTNGAKQKQKVEQLEMATVSDCDHS